MHKSDVVGCVQSVLLLATCATTTVTATTCVQNVALDMSSVMTSSLACVCRSFSVISFKSFNLRSY